MYRLLALDIDGTLVNSQNELTDATRTAVLRAKDAGVEVVLATGRRYSRVLPLVEPLRMHVPLVTASGALIKDPVDHRTLFRADFGPGVLADLLAVLSSVGHDPVLYADTYADGFDYYCRRIDVEDPALDEFFTVNAGCERVYPELLARPPDGIFAGCAMGTREAMLALERELERRLPGRLYAHVLRSPRYHKGFMCEIAPAGVSKWLGVLHLADERGIAAEEICAVGDDVNDIPMIRSAGLGVAMGNALAEVKAAADRIAPCHDSDGLVEVVNWVLEG
jgi:Cof subfamily protein (haloacid dehalogenase superfamily)